MRRFVLTLLLLVSACGDPDTSREVPQVKAKSEPLSPHAAFEVAVARHTNNRGQLRAFRGVRERRRRKRRGDPETPITVNYVAQMLQEGQSYPGGTGVLFLSLERGVFERWLIHERGLAAYVRSETAESELTSALERLRRSLQMAPRGQGRGLRLRDNGPSPAESLKAEASALTSLLLPTQIATRLVNLSHLVIVPVLDLGAVPWCLLQPFEDEKSLIDRVSISIAPSLLDLQKVVAPWEGPTAGRILAVGNPKSPQGLSLPSLPGAEREARALQRFDNVTLYTGEDAVESVVARASSRAHVLYFATHGVVHPDEPLDGSFLALTTGDNETYRPHGPRRSGPEARNDGRWTAREIQELRLEAELAILSACSTGRGAVHKGGVIGLARAFQIAGVPRVVMSLWDVDDNATRVLMDAFFRHLDESIPAEALRQAMLEMRARDADPRHWAAFTLFGTPR